MIIIMHFLEVPWFIIGVWYRQVKFPDLLLVYGTDK